jgi:RNA polymerase sigma factor (sigma-70 family)
MSDDSDRELMRQALQGNDKAFAILLRRYEERLFNTVYRLLGDEAAAQDVVQEAFINAYQSLKEFKGDSQFFTWLYRIAYKAAIDHKKKLKGTSSTPPVRSDEDEERIAAALNRLGLRDTRQVDGQMIAEALRGNDRAYGDLMALYRDALSRMLKELLDDPRERMTAQVQVFFQVRESLGRYRDDKPFVTWLYEIAKEIAQGLKQNRDIPPG